MISMNSNFMDLTGMAMLDYFNGDHTVFYIAERDDGMRINCFLHNIFRTFEDFSDFEKKNTWIM